MTALQIFADAYREMMRPFAIGYLAIMGTAALVFIGWTCKTHKE